jgi:hypothetical protein
LLSAPLSSSLSSPGCVTAIAAAPGTIDFATVTTHQRDCPATAKIPESSSLKVELLEVGNASLLCDTSRNLVRSITPLVDRAAVFTAMQGLAHPGIRAMRHLLASRVVCHGVSSDINKWCRVCQQCCSGKVIKQPAAPTQAISVPGHHISHLHVDLWVPFPPPRAGPATSSPS